MYAIPNDQQDISILSIAKPQYKRMWWAPRLYSFKRSCETPVSEHGRFMPLRIELLWDDILLLDRIYIGHHVLCRASPSESNNDPFQMLGCFHSGLCLWVATVMPAEQP